MMKALIAILFVLSPLTAVAENPVNLLETKVSFDGSKVRVSEVFEFLGGTLKTAPNIVFKGDVGEHEVSSLKVKDVTLGNLFRVLETIADVEIQIVEDHNNLKEVGQANDDPFAAAPPSKFLTSSGIVVISSIRPTARPSTTARVPVRTVKPKEELKTEVVLVKDLGFPIENIIEVITTTWRNLDERWVLLGNIAYHEPTKLLIITVPEDGLEVAQKILGALMPDYQKSLDEKKNPFLRSIPSSNNRPGPVQVQRTHSVSPANRNSGSAIRPGTPTAPSGAKPVLPRSIPLPSSPKPAVPPSDPFGN